jgi:hypothetical protein
LPFSRIRICLWFIRDHNKVRFVLVDHVVNVKFKFFMNIVGPTRGIDTRYKYSKHHQGSRWRAIRAKKSPCGCSLRFVLVPKEKRNSNVNLVVKISKFD